MRGQFILGGKTYPNTIVQEGAEQFIKMLLQNAAIGGGGNFYIGLCGELGIAKDATLVDLSDELGPAGGYARKLVEHSAVGWPTANIVNTQGHGLTKIVNFAASGANFSAAYSRVFLCNVLSGTAGILFSYSAKIDPPVQINDGENQNIQYEFFL